MKDPSTCESGTDTNPESPMRARPLRLEFAYGSSQRRSQALRDSAKKSGQGKRPWQGRRNKHKLLARPLPVPRKSAACEDARPVNAARKTLQSGSPQSSGVPAHSETVNHEGKHDEEGESESVSRARPRKQQTTPSSPINQRSREHAETYSDRGRLAS